MLIKMLFLDVSLMCLAGVLLCPWKGILPFYSFLEEIQWYNQLFQSLKLEMKIFQAIANPHRRPRPSPFFSFSAVRERSGRRDGFKACDCSRESCVLSEMRLNGCTSPLCHQWECWPPPPLPLQALLRAILDPSRPASMLTDRREHENTEHVWLKSIRNSYSMK